MLEHTWLLYEHQETVTFEKRAFLFSSQAQYEAFLAHRKRDSEPPLGDGWYEARLPRTDGPARLTRATGTEHLQRLLSLPHFEELAFNCGSNSRLYIVAEWARQALQGVDIRPGARKLQARGEWEKDLYPGQHGLYDASGLEWEEGYVEGSSRVLCMACLANLVLMRAEWAEPVQKEETVRWALDVLAHLEDDRLPPHTIRSTYGRHLVEQNPRLLEGATLREALAKLTNT